MTYVYIHSETDPHGVWLYTVGFYGPDGKFVPEHNTTDTTEAANRVHRLNGGNDAALLQQRDNLLVALKDIRHTVNAAMPYRRINKGVAEDIDTTITAAIKGAKS